MILITGFKPFLGDSINPSQVLVESVQDPLVTKLILPVEFNRAFDILNQYIIEFEPKVVVMFGLASGRAKVSIEKIALNWRQSRNSDESGFLPSIGRIDESSDLALMTSYPVDHLYDELQKLEVPVEISFSAGTFVCNDLYFKVVKQYPKLKSVFIHVPCIPEQRTENIACLDLSLLRALVSEVIQFSKKII